MEQLKSWMNSLSGAAPSLPPGGAPTLSASSSPVASLSSSAGKKAPSASPATLLAGAAILGASGFLLAKFARWAKFKDHILPRRPSKEERLLRYVFQHAREGDVDSVIHTIDQFCYGGDWMMNVGDKKGAILDEEMRKKLPRVVVELGGYCGYSALRIARLLPAEGHLYSIELDPFHAAVATKIAEFAGVGDRVTVLVGTAASRIATLTERFGVDKVDLLFLDHLKTVYKSDLMLFEQSGLIKPGSVLVADNCLFPGCPDYVEYVRTNANYISMCHDAKIEYDDSVDDQVWVSLRK